MSPDALLHFVHTPLFDQSMARVPMTDDELAAMQRELCENPDAGDLVKRAGGARKVRVAIRAGGKRGGARVIYYYDGHETIYLLLAYRKGQAETLSPEGEKLMKQLIRELDR